MTFLLKNNDDEILAGNRYYWKITKLLQDIPSNMCHLLITFKLHSKTWRTIFVVPKDGFLYAHTCSFIRNDVNHLFDLETGIVEHNLKEIVAVKTETGSIVNLISRSELDSILLSNKVLYLFIEIRRKDENVQKVKDRKQLIERDYRELLLSGKNSDVTLNVKHKKFYCHRCILAARSPVFAAMMKNEMEEEVSGEVFVEDTDPNVFQKFLLFLYTGREDYLSWKNVTDLHKLADKYGVEDIKNVCRNDVKENIYSVNFCELFKISLLHHDPEITKTTVKFFLKHSEDIVKCKNWATFLSENSKKWLCVDHVKDNMTAENFFFFYKLSQIQNDSELTEATVKFFLKKSKDIVQSENWLTFQDENLDECNVLIKALDDK